MTTEELRHRLVEAVQSGDVIGETEKLVDALRSLDADLDAVNTILKCLEDNPGLDFGMPGPLVHFVERFHKRGYEVALRDSVSRQPTSHTVWMLNRLINGTKDATERTSLISIMKSVEANANADPTTREIAKDFLALHESP